MVQDKQNASEKSDNRNFEFPTPSGQPKVKRGRGRPKGSKNKPKNFTTETTAGWDQEAIEMTRLGKLSKARSVSMHRKWQREYIKPQFVINRKEAYEIFFKYLRSAAGKSALKDLMVKGSPGVGKLSDSALGKYLEQTSLLSRYPHEVIIRG